MDGFNITSVPRKTLPRAPPESLKSLSALVRRAFCATFLTSRHVFGASDLQSIPGLPKNTPRHHGGGSKSRCTAMEEWRGRECPGAAIRSICRYILYIYIYIYIFIYIYIYMPTGSWATLLLTVSYHTLLLRFCIFWLVGNTPRNGCI